MSKKEKKICIDHSFRFKRRRFRPMSKPAYDWRVLMVYKCEHCPREKVVVSNKIQYDTQQKGKMYPINFVEPVTLSQRFKKGFEMLLPADRNNPLR